MKFNNWINNNKLKEIEEICVNCCCKYPSINVCDVFSKLNERLVLRNPYILLGDEQQFKGLVITHTNWIIHDILNLKSSSFKEIGGEAKSIPDKEYIEDNTENRVKCIKNSQYWQFYLDRYLHNKTIKELSLQYSITERQVEWKIKQIKNLLMGKKEQKVENTYKGIVRKLDNKIIKIYPHSKDLEKDGFNRSVVSKICNGKLKTNIHKGFQFEFVNKTKENA